MMMNFVASFTLLVFLISTYGAHITDAARYAEESRLLDNLLGSYHKGALPADDGPVDVQVAFKLMSFDFIDEANEMASIHARISKSWKDPRLEWDPTEYNGTDTVLVDSNDIWLPDITFWNGAMITETLDSDVLLYSSGNLFRVPQDKIDFICRMDFTFFPYDKQVCVLKLGSWHHHTGNINVTSSSADLLTYHTTRDFTITKFEGVKNTVLYPCCPDAYADVTYKIHLERVSGAYSVKLVLPAALTGFLVLATFLLPPASQEKITLCGLLFLGLLLQLSYLHDTVPAGGKTMLGDYLAFVLFIDFFATVIAVVSYNIHTRSSSSRMQHHNMMEMEGDANDLKVQMPKDPKRELLRYLDIASFVVFSVVFIVGMAIILGRRG